MNHLLKKEEESEEKQKPFETEEDGWMKIQDLLDSKQNHHWRAHSSPVVNCLFSNSGTQLLTCPKGATSVTLWDLATSEPSPLVVLDRGLLSASILRLAFDSTDSFLSLTTDHGTTHLYHLRGTSKKQRAIYKIKKGNKEGRNAVYTTLWLNQVDGADCLRLLSADDSGCSTSYDFKLDKDDARLSVDLLQATEFDFTTVLESTPGFVGTASNGMSTSAREKTNAADPTFWHAQIETDIDPVSSRPFWTLPNILQYQYDEVVDESGKVTMGQPALTDLPQAQLVTFYTAVHPPHGYLFSYFGWKKILTGIYRTTTTSSKFPVVTSQQSDKIEESLSGAMGSPIDTAGMQPLTDRLDKRRCKFFFLFKW
jgi:WD40 repeat protein